MFLGVSTLSLDAKGRLAIPAKHRDTLAQCCGARLWVTISPNGEDRCLWLYPDNEWREIARRLSRLGTMKPQVQRIQRLMLGHASEQDLDGQGRILIANELRSFAGLDKRVALVGQGHKFEIWDEQTWEVRREQLIGEPIDFESLSQDLDGVVL